MWSDPYTQQDSELPNRNTPTNDVLVQRKYNLVKLKRYGKILRK